MFVCVVACAIRKKKRKKKKALQSQTGACMRMRLRTRTYLAMFTCFQIRCLFCCRLVKTTIPGEVSFFFFFFFFNRFSNMLSFRV